MIRLRTMLDHPVSYGIRNCSHTATDDYRSGLQPSCLWTLHSWGDAPCWYRSRLQRFKLSLFALRFKLNLLAPLCFVALVSSSAPAQTTTQTQSQAVAQVTSSSTTTAAQQFHIRIFNAKTNKPIIDERLNVAFRADQIGSVAMPTDKNGLIVVDPGKAITIRILSNMYADCRPRGELYTDYSIATIFKSGITTGNLCSTISLPPKPGELLLFELPKTSIPVYPKPPASTLPHSDELPASH